MNGKLKYCTKCGEAKPATEEYFSVRSDTNKFNAQCKSCCSKRRRVHYLNNRNHLLALNKKWKANNKERRREVHKKWYEENKEKILQHSRDMYAANIEEERLRNKRYRDSHKEYRSRKRRARYQKTKERENAQAIEWYQKNKNKHLENGRRWRSANPDKAKAIINKYRTQKKNNGGKYSDRDVKRQYHYQHGECFYCGCSLADNYHIDHVIPISRGGSNFCGNIVLSCPSCNSSKSNKFIVEWKKAS